MTLRLLIADDCCDDAVLIVFKLKRAGFAVEWQRVEQEAEFARALPAADLVICDYAMPAFSPFRALQQIRESGRETPLLVISGSIPTEAADRLISLGAAGYLYKDRLETLGAAVRDALATRRVCT